MNEKQVRDIIRKLVGEEDIYGVTWSSDGSQLQARVFVEGLPYLQTFRLDPDSGSYYLENEQPLGQQKL